MGIVDFRASDVLLRMTAKTLPGEQWGVERALRIIIKDRFDEAGIDIPLPQIVIHRAGGAGE
jgi:small conductance mechanosensitive channel